MIRIKYTNESLELTGHAGYADYGKDIVCASVSTLVVCSINNMKSIDEDSVDYKDDGNKITIKVFNNNYSKIIFENLIQMLEELAKDYPKNIKIESEK